MFNSGIERDMPSPLYFGLTAMTNPLIAIVTVLDGNNEQIMK